MKIIFIALCCLVSISAFSQTQAEMNEEAFATYKKADKELNSVYKKILVEYKSDTAFIRNLKISQRIWVTFRDAELNMKYPDREPYYYGSILPLCMANFLEKLTLDRIKTLKVWLVGVPDGDVCSGSVKTIK
jgi:uncharacterized protein YecT (DUF1311 family)